MRLSLWDTRWGSFRDPGVSLTLWAIASAIGRIFFLLDSCGLALGPERPTANPGGIQGRNSPPLLAFGDFGDKIQEWTPPFPKERCRQRPTLGPSAYESSLLGVPTRNPGLQGPPEEFVSGTQDFLCNQIPDPRTKGSSWATAPAFGGRKLLLDLDLGYKKVPRRPRLEKDVSHGGCFPSWIFTRTAM